jgi:HD superfamily phosphohydrolase
MTYTESENLLREINNGASLKHSDDEYIQRVFNALTISDVHLIEESAENFLQDLDLKTLRNNSTDAEEFSHRVTMDVFNATMLDCLQIQFPQIDSSVEHDIPSWISANSEIVTIGNLKKMENLICKKPSQKDVIEFHQQVNLDTFESDINGILQKTWQDIELKINNAIANYSA